MFAPLRVASVLLAAAPFAIGAQAPAPAQHAVQQSASATAQPTASSQASLPFSATFGERPSGLTGGPPLAPTIPSGTPYSFVVLGHLRGDLSGPNSKLPEIIAGVRALHPDFLLLTGDVVWGDTEKKVASYASVRRQWEYLDSALATLGVPVFRAPGNHDINDIPTRDIYRERYGILPQAITFGDSRLILLSSAWIPSDGDTRKNPFVRPADLTSEQKAWLATELPKPGFAHTFVVMHHLFWWQDDDGPWWRDVHPLLAKARVDALFSGDYGPMKFSHLTRDGVRYFQTSLEDSVSKEIQRGMLSSRLLSAQFDNFLHVRVDGPSVDVKVHTTAETSTRQFTPAMWKFINAPAAPMPLGTWLLTVVGRKKLAVAGALLVACFLAGFALGRAGGRRR